MVQQRIDAELKATKGSMTVEIGILDSEPSSGIIIRTAHKCNFACEGAEDHGVIFYDINTLRNGESEILYLQVIPDEDVGGPYWRYPASRAVCGVCSLLSLSEWRRRWASCRPSSSMA